MKGLIYPVGRDVCARECLKKEMERWRKRGRNREPCWLVCFGLSIDEKVERTFIKGIYTFVSRSLTVSLARLLGRAALCRHPGESVFTVN